MLSLCDQQVSFVGFDVISSYLCVIIVQSAGVSLWVLV